MWNRFRVHPVAVAVIGLMGAGCVVESADGNGNGWGKEKASRDYRATLSLQGAERLSVEVGAGRLEVTGGPGAEIEIEAVFRAFAKKTERAEEILADVKLVEKRRGGTLTLEADGPENLRNEWYAIDLVLRVPEDLALKIADGSGEIRIEKMRGGLEIADGSGDIFLDTIGGDTEIHDGSGEIRIQNLDATLDDNDRDRIRIHDGSGDIVLRNLRGNLMVNDGSGGIDISDLEGSLDLTDGSGGITVVEVTGSVEVSDGSGSMRIVQVGGDVGIADGSGNIDVRDIGGDVRVRSAGSGGLQIDRVAGSIHKP